MVTKMMIMAHGIFWQVDGVAWDDEQNFSLKANRSSRVHLEACC